MFSKIKKRVEEIDSRLCVGIDPHSYLVHPENLVEWSVNLARQTAPNAACFKINTAFFEAHGYKGVKAMEDVISQISALAPVILDAKRGDIPTTAQAYAQSISRLNVDAVTINPFMGMDSIKPYLDKQAVLMLCHTSNDGAIQFQSNTFSKIAKEASRDPSRLGLVVGATQDHVLDEIREAAPFNWLLVPGIGKQNGNLTKTLDRGWGNGNILISSSRSIAEADSPRAESLKLRNQIQNLSPTIPFQLKKMAHQLIQTDCVTFGSFKLKSGSFSPFYIDIRKLVSYPMVFKNLIKTYAIWTKHLRPQGLTTIPVGGLPIASALAYETGLPLCYPRPLKRHGTRKLIEGDIRENCELLLIDDVITNGISALETLPKLSNYTIKDMVVLIDRGIYGANVLKQQGVQLHSVFRMESLLWFWLKENLISDRDYQRSISFLYKEAK